MPSLLKERSLPRAGEKENKCPDCHFCQMCNKNRCRLCRSGGPKKSGSGLGTGFTYGQYMNWKKNRGTKSGCL
jgi:hypothetical protein